MTAGGNLFAGIPPSLPEELLETLLRAGEARLERIVSRGQRTPPGAWLEEDEGEWVVLLRGTAGLRFADEADVRVLAPGDWLDIAPRRRHRVEWTEAEPVTVWLALHYRPAGVERR